MLFFAHVFQGKPLFKTFNFPAKKLRKIRMRQFSLNLFFEAMSNSCSKWRNFPAKKLRKIEALKIRMRRFFFFFAIRIFKITFLLLVLNKVKKLDDVVCRCICNLYFRS